MNTLIKRLPLFAFVLVAFSALAFNGPIVQPESATTIWAPDPLNPGQYIDVTEEVDEDRYRCDEASMECTVTFSGNDPINGTKTVLEEGQFVALP